MGKRSPAPPPAPDYAAAATAQGAANLDAARLTARLSNPNISTPLGGQRVTFGRPVLNQPAYEKAMADYQKQLDAYNASRPQPPAQGSPTTTTGGTPGRMTSQGLERAPGMPDSDFIAQDLGSVGLGDLYGQGGIYGGGYGGGLNAGGYTGDGTLYGGGLYGGFQNFDMGPPVAPTKEQFTTMTDLDTPYIEQYLTPEAQKTLEAQQRVELALAGLGEQGIGIAQKALSQPFTPNLPGIQLNVGQTRDVNYNPDLFQYGKAGVNVTPGDISQGPNLMGMGQFGVNVTPDQIARAPNLLGMGQAIGDVTAGQIAQGPNLMGMGQAGVDVNAGRIAQGPDLLSMGRAGTVAGDKFGLAQGGVNLPQLQMALDTSGLGNIAYAPETERLQRRLDTSNLAQMPVNAGMTAQGAILSRLAPQLQQERSQLQTQLVNQGIPPGSEAYRVAMRQQNERENDLLNQAAVQGINLDMAARAQGLGEQQTLGSFANTAANQIFQNRLAQQQAQNQAQQQAFGQRVQAGEFGNAAQMAYFGAGLQNQDAANRAIAQNFSQALQSQAMANAALGQNQQAAIQQQAAANAAQQLGFGQQMDVNAARNAALAQNQQAALQQQAAANAAQQLGVNQQININAARNAALAANQQAALQQQQAANAAQQLGFGQQMDVNAARNAALAANQQAALQQQQAANAAQQLGFGQQMDLNAARNAAIAANQQTGLTQQQAFNAAQNQAYNQALQNAQFFNTAQGQSLAQQLALRNQPLNEIAALMSGAQVQMPQFQGYTGANVQAAPLMDAIRAQDASAMQRYGLQANQAATNAQGLFSLGKAALPFILSDRRLKSNVVRIGTHPLGIGVYEYDIGGQRQRGVMADEVESVKPEAVMTGADGYKRVNYGAL